MINHISYSIEKENLLLKDLTKEITLSNKLGILGGHYILLYNEDLLSLEPSIWQASTNNSLKEFSRTLMGDFPVNSYKFALKVSRIASQKGIINKFFLLVNDHFFHSRNNSQIFNMSNLNHTKLKRQYFDNNKIPEIFVEIARKNNINIIEHIDKPDKSEGISGRNQYLMSETHLRRKFDRSLKKKALQTNHFKLIKKYNAKSELYFNNNGNNICLTQNGACDCSGEVIQLLFGAFINKYDTVILIVPQECHYAVTSAIIPALTLAKTNNIRVKGVTILSGFGDNKYNGVTKSSVNIEKFKVSE